MYVVVQIFKFLRQKRKKSLPTFAPVLQKSRERNKNLQYMSS